MDGQHNVLETTGLAKKYGKLQAVDNMNLTIPKGSVFGILGPNGSGKTTTLGMVLGVVNKSAGKYSWFGQTENHQTRKRIGAILETPCFYPYLSASQNLQIVAAIKEVDKNRIFPVLEKVNLGERARDKFSTYSLGMKQRLAIASALLADPEVMILDEPTNGLDPQGIADIRSLITDLAKEGRTIILASHLLDEVQKICSDFVVLKSGKKIFQGKVSEVRNSGSILELDSPEKEDLLAALQSCELLNSMRQQASAIEVTLQKGADSYDLNKYLVNRNVVLSYLKPKVNSLEQQFLEILKGEK